MEWWLETCFSLGDSSFIFLDAKTYRVHIGLECVRAMGGCHVAKSWEFCIWEEMEESTSCCPHDEQGCRRISTRPLLLVEIFGGRTCGVGLAFKGCDCMSTSWDLKFITRGPPERKSECERSLTSSAITVELAFCGYLAWSTSCTYHG